MHDSGLSASVPADWRASYETRIAGRVTQRCWARRAGRRGRLHRFRFVRKAGGQCVTAVLLCDDRLRPVTYRQWQDGRALVLRFRKGRVQARLPDGTVLRRPADGADILLPEPFQLPVLALMLRLLRRQGRRSFHGTAFASGLLGTVPLDLERRGDGLRLGGRKRLELDAAGEPLATGDGTRRTRLPWPAVPRTAPPEPPPPYRPPPDLPVHLTDGIAVARPVVTLTAALAVPAAGPARAAALFLAGSGRHDRHGVDGGLGYGPFLDRLAALGVVSLRIDSRGAGDTPLGADILDYGYDGIVADARAALDALAARPEAAGLPLFVLGHSQGALVAMELAARRPGIAGVAALAGPGRRIDRLIEWQIRHLLPPDQRGGALARHREFVRCLDRPDWTADTVPHHVFLRRPVRLWMAEMMRREPVRLAAALPCPLLVVQGTEDAQVPAADARRLAEAARAAGVPVALRLLPRTGHRFVFPPAAEPMGRRLVAVAAGWMRDIAAGRPDAVPDPRRAA